MEQAPEGQQQEPRVYSVVELEAERKHEHRHQKQLQAAAKQVPILRRANTKAAPRQRQVPHDELQFFAYRASA